MIYGVKYLLEYQHKHKKLLPYVSVLGFLAGFFYLGTTINFILYIFTANNLSPYFYGWLSYSWIPPATLIGLWLGFEIFKPEFQKQIRIIFIILWGIYWICLFGFPEIMIEASSEQTDTLLEISLNHILMVLTAFYILSLLFIQSGGFFYLRYKMKMSGSEPGEVTHITYLGIGWALFGIASILDAILPSSLMSLVVIARIMMSVGYYFIFTGFSEPKGS